MKKISILLGILLQLYPVVSFAALSFQDKQSIPFNQLLINGGFENGQAQWTVGGSGMTAALDTTNFSGGASSALLTFTTSTTGKYSQSQTPTVQIASTNMEATCRVKTSQTTIQFCAVNAGTAINCVSVPSTNTWQTVTSNFVGQASGSVGVQVQTNGTSTTGTANVDDCYVGPARNIGTVAQAQLIGQVKITGCTGAWGTTSTSFAAFSAQTSCVYTVTSGTSGTAPGTMIPGITFASLAPGNYVLKYEGIFTNLTAAKSAYLQFTDGTNTALETSQAGSAIAIPGIQQSITYSSSQSNVTFQIFGKTDSSGTTDLFGTTASPGVISVYYFPTSAQGAVAANQQTQPTISFVTATSHTGGFSANSSGTYTPPLGVTRIEVEAVGSGGGGGGTTGAGSGGGATTFGTSFISAGGGAGGPAPNAGTSSTGGSGSGSGCQVPTTGGNGSYGQYPATGVQGPGGIGGGSGFGSGGGYGGSPTAAGGAGATGGGGGGAGSASAGVGGGQGGGGGGGCYSLINNPLSSYAFTVGAAGGGGSGTAGGAGGAGYIKVTEWYQGQNAPILTNSITTNAAGAWRVESATVIDNCTAASTGTPSVSNGTGFLTTPSNASCNAVGDLSLTFATSFSSAATCTCTASNTGGADICSIVGAVTSSAMRVFLSNTSGTGQSTLSASITCMGPR